MCKSTIFKCLLSSILGLLMPAMAIGAVVYSAVGGLDSSSATGDELSQRTTFEGVGSTVTSAQLVNWDISVYYDGENLPSGSGTLTDGETIYQEQCAMCHGEFGEGAKGYPKMLGAPMDEFIQTAQDGEDNVSIRGVNNLWAHAPTLYDFIRRAMPFFAPQSLTDDQTYAVTGYVLSLAEVIDGEVEDIDAAYLASIKMPSAENFYTDTRPDIQNVRCMQDCYSHSPDIKGSAIQGDDISISTADKNENS